MLVIRRCLIDLELTANQVACGIEPLSIDAPSVSVLAIAGPDDYVAAVVSNRYSAGTATNLGGRDLGTRSCGVDAELACLEELAMHLERPDVGRSVAGEVAGINGRGTYACPAVDRWTTRQQPMRGDKSTVVSQDRIEQRIIYQVSRACQSHRAVAVDVIAQRRHGLVGISAGRAVEDRVLEANRASATLSVYANAGGCVVEGDRDISGRHGSVGPKSTAIASGRVAADGHVGERHDGTRTCVVDSAAVHASGIAADGHAVKRHDAAIVVQTTAPVAGDAIAESGIGCDERSVVIESSTATGAVPGNYDSRQV